MNKRPASAMTYAKAGLAPPRGPALDLDTYLERCPETAAFDAIASFAGEEAVAAATSEDSGTTPNHTKLILSKLTAIALRKLQRRPAGFSFSLEDSETLSQLTENSFSQDPVTACIKLDAMITAQAIETA